VKLNFKSLTFACLTLLPISTFAEFKSIDSIIAIVSNDVITQSDLDKKITTVKSNFASQKQALPPEAEIKKQVLDKLIIDSLQMQMANQAGLRISDERLNDTIKRIADKKGLSEKALQKQIEKEGIDFTEFREQIRSDMTLQQLQQSRLRNRIQISEQEVENYLDSAEGKKINTSRYKMSHILLPIADNASDADIKKAKQIMRTLRLDILAGKLDYAKLMQGATINGYQVEGNSLDWLEKDDLPTLFAKSIKHLKKNDISNPKTSGAGIHLIKMDDMDNGNAEIVHQVSSRHILIKPSEVRSDAQAKQLSEELYQRIQKGEDFTLIAKEYSEDPGSSLQGGNLGWTQSTQFVPPFAKRLDSLKKNEMSAPFKTEFGWHILQKLDERDQDMSLENQKNKAYQAIYERKFGEELEAWLITLREEAFIEIKQ